MPCKLSQEAAVEPDFKVVGSIWVNGELCPVTNMFTVEGDETSDPDLAATAVVRVSEDEWVSFETEHTGIYRLN